MSRSVHLKRFLQPSDRSPPDLGTVIRLHTEEKKPCLAADFLYQLLEHSEKPDTLAREILHECEFTDAVRPIGMFTYTLFVFSWPTGHSCQNSSGQGDLSLITLGGRIECWPPFILCLLTMVLVLSLIWIVLHHITWHTSALHVCCRSSSAFTPLFPIISLYLSVWNPPRPSIPQASTHPTPDHYRTSNIKELIKLSTEKRVSALKKLVLSMHMLYFERWNFLQVELRDNALQCPITRIPFQHAQHGVVSELSHILPFAVHGNLIRNYELLINETNNGADGDP